MKIMYICTGNICRSAMAEGMLKNELQNKNIENVEVYSCGIYAVTGEYATDNAIEATSKYDVDISKHRATNIKDSNIKAMDLILCATNSHKQSVVYLYPELKDKVYTMKEYAGLYNNGQDIDIKDPWGFNIDVYKNCIKEIDETIQKTIEKIK